MHFVCRTPFTEGQSRTVLPTNVRDRRNKCETFPRAILASMFSFNAEEFFSVPPSVKEVPNVEFGGWTQLQSSTPCIYFPCCNVIDSSHESELAGHS